MAINLSGRTRGRGRYKPLAEINVTPMVDVMLVLLIIFMVAAPLMTSGVTVDLPKASAQPLAQDSEPITISINAESKIFLGDGEVPLTDLAARLAAASDNKLDRRIFVRGDKAVPYGRIMEVMSTVNQAGFSKVALLAEQTAATPTTPASTGAAPATPLAPLPTANVPASRPPATISGPPGGTPRRPAR